MALRVFVALLFAVAAGSSPLALAGSTPVPTGLLLRRADVPAAFKLFRTRPSSVPEFGLGLPDLAQTPAAASEWFTGEVDSSEELLSVAFVAPTATAAHRLFRALVRAPCGQYGILRQVSSARVGDESQLYRDRDAVPAWSGGLWCGFWRDRSVVAFIAYWDKRPGNVGQRKLGGKYLLPLMRKQEARIRASH